MSAPVIGLTTYREHAAWGVWQQRADLLPTQYADAVEATGGVPLLLPPTGQPGVADVVVSRLDGLVISGGADVDPARYDASPHPRTAGWREDRDAWELALLDAADAVGIVASLGFAVLAALLVVLAPASSAAPRAATPSGTAPPPR